MSWLEIIAAAAVATLLLRWFVWLFQLFTFAYVHLPGETLANGEGRQLLKLAGLYRRPVFVNRRFLFEFGEDVRTLFDNAANPSPESVSALAVSPGGPSLLALTAELPIGALDNNVRIWAIADGRLRASFNEHSLSGLLNRSNCEAPEFQAYLESERLAGVPDNVLAGYRFALLVEGREGNAQRPTLIEWIDEDRLNMRWRFEGVVVETSVPLTLNLHFHVRILAAGGIAVEPPTPFAVPAPRPGRIALAADGTLLFGGAALEFMPTGATRRASRVAD